MSPRVSCNGNATDASGQPRPGPSAALRYRHRQAWVSSMRDVRKRVVAASGCPRGDSASVAMGTDRLAQHGRHVTSGVNVPLAWAMFGGSTLLLFLLCYCCQKKIQEDNLTLAQRTAETSREPLTLAAVESPVSPSIILIPPPPSPPPAYDTVVKKMACNEESSPPPPYDVAMASLQSAGFV